MTEHCVAYKQNRPWQMRFVDIYLLQDGTRTVVTSFECLPVFHKTLDIQLILQLSRCLSVTNISKHNMFSMCGFLLMEHNSLFYKVSL